MDRKWTRILRSAMLAVASNIHGATLERAALPPRPPKLDRPACNELKMRYQAIGDSLSRAPDVQRAREAIRAVRHRFDALVNEDDAGELKKEVGRLATALKAIDVRVLSALPEEDPGRLTDGLDDARRGALASLELIGNECAAGGTVQKATWWQGPSGPRRDLELFERSLDGPLFWWDLQRRDIEQGLSPHVAVRQVLLEVEKLNVPPRHSEWNVPALAADFFYEERVIPTSLERTLEFMRNEWEAIVARRVGPSDGKGRG